MDDHVQRIDARSASAEEIAELDDGETIFVIEHALDELDKQTWLSRLLELRGKEVVHAKLGNARNHCSGSFKCTLETLWNLLPRSSRDENFFLMEEDVLKVRELIDKVWLQLPALIREDHFPGCFPQGFRPSPLCLVMGGAGARSKLHADPLSWTGWNWLAYGHKAWRFYRQVPQNADVAFKSHRTRDTVLLMSHPPNLEPANYSFNIAGGWLSEVDVFASVSGDASNPDRPHTFGPDLSRHPAASQATNPIEVLQRPGDIVIFPGHWFHQTYHYDQTVAIAGQVLNSRNLKRVMCHILDWCKLSSPSEQFWAERPPVIVREVLIRALDKFAPDRGEHTFTSVLQAGQRLHWARGYSEGAQRALRTNCKTCLEEEVTCSWTQTSNEVEISFRKEDFGLSDAKFVKATIFPLQIRIDFKERILLQGNLPHAIDPKGSKCILSNEGLKVTLTKVEDGKIWNQLLKESLSTTCKLEPAERWKNGGFLSKFGSARQEQVRPSSEDALSNQVILLTEFPKRKQVILLPNNLFLYRECLPAFHPYSSTAKSKLCDIQLYANLVEYIIASLFVLAFIMLALVCWGDLRCIHAIFRGLRSFCSIQAALPGVHAPLLKTT